MIGCGKEPLLAAIAAIFVLGASGCGAKKENYGCPTIEAQGGSYVGKWVVDSARTCTAPYDPVTSADWCSQLVYDANGVRQAYLGHPKLELTAGSVEFVGDGTYHSELTFATDVGAGHTTFPYACLTAYGREPSCELLASDLELYLSDPGGALQSYRLTPLQALPYYPVGLVPQPSYSGIMCHPNDANGCDCEYTVGLVVPDRGTAATDATTLTLYSATSAPPYINDYVSDGAGMAMTGGDGFDLLGQPGLRTLTLLKQ